MADSPAAFLKCAKFRKYDLTGVNVQFQSEPKKEVVISYQKFDAAI